MKLGEAATVNIYRLTRISPAQIKIELPGGRTDYAIRYPHNGALAYDFPELLPRYVKDAVVEAYTEAM